MAFWLAVVWLLLCANLAWAALAVSDLEPSGPRWTITFSKSLRVDGIEAFGPAPGREATFRLPLSGASGGRYDNIRILSQGLYEAILAALSGKKVRARPEESNAAMPRFEILKLRPTKGASRRLANVEVVFEKDMLVVLGVMRTREKLWIAYPFGKKGGKYVSQFTILYGSLKRRVDAAVLKAYAQL